MANRDLSRRAFGVLSVGAGLAVTAEARAEEVVVTDVDVKTPDGTCDAVFIHPATGKHPGVVIWPDAFGLRPTFRDFGKRLAADGYAVLIVNPFYRSAKAPGIPAGFNFQNPDDRAKLAELRKRMTPDGIAGDARAFVAFIDSQPAVDKKKKIGVQGYCMGGSLTFRTAAAVPDRIGAGASFHGGGLVTTDADSPHLLVPRMKARFLIAIAENDDQQQPDAKDKLRDAFAAAHLPAEIEVYPARHGWCVPDMPAATDGTPIYDHDQAERAWSRLLALYKEALG